MEYLLTVQKTEMLSHDVIHVITDKPTGYKFTPGQATEVKLVKPGFEEEVRPFTFTGLADNNRLEFMIKCYDERNSVTAQIRHLQPGDQLRIGDAWGAIAYHGPGVFIAGGAGLTPFVAILRQLREENKLAGNTLIFSNKTRADIFLKNELDAMRGLHRIYVLTRENAEGFHFGRISRTFLAKYIRNFSQPFYVCGTDSFTLDVNHALQELGAKPELLIFEK